MWKIPKTPFLINRLFVNIQEMPKDIDTAMTKTPKKLGRPPREITREIEDTILEGIVSGKSIRDICKNQKIEDDKFPCVERVFAHLARNEDFSKRYTRARGQQQDTWADEIISIADGTHPDFEKKDANERKLAIETRKWVMGKLRPTRYGDKIQAEITGKDGTPLIPVQEINVKLLDSNAREALKFALSAATAVQEAEDVEILENDDDE